MEPGPQTITVEGWVRTKRDSKTVSFIEVNDGSCLKGLQVVADKASLDNNLLNSISTGCSVVCKGKLVPSEGGNQAVELKAEEITIVGETPEDYPLQKKRHSLEYLREIAHLRPRTNTIGAVARVRSTMAYAVHSFFQSNGFYYVNTPLITASDCEGAGQMFQVTTLDMDNVP
ncbi:MAG: asparagine--tRNA ligase, partial [Sphaerochaetaceae bacterium]|nr:asparagine--tRNA ligase [Sphaerochaetaceae bacterium]